jgi:hypothetical protein
MNDGQALWEIESALELLPHSTALQEAHAGIYIYIYRYKKAY